jgi:environmental stress-induced protein Ves
MTAAMAMHLFDLSTTPRMPWKNGGGSTQEIACWPPGADMNGFEWRVSLATVDRPGPFSVFPGIDRQIMLLGGDGLHLRGPGWAHRLGQAWQPFAFAGDDAVDSDLLGGPSQDFNLMQRRGLWHGLLRVVGDAQLPGSTPAGLCMVLRGAWRWEGQGEVPRVLVPGQGLWWAGESAAPGRLAPVFGDGVPDAPALAWIALQRGTQP